jgi:hypothetical protein
MRHSTKTLKKKLILVFEIIIIIVFLNFFSCNYIKIYFNFFFLKTPIEHNMDQ